MTEETDLSQDRSHNRTAITMMISPVYALFSPTIALLLTLSPLSVKEVVKVYGKLAGSTCYGRVAPPASSCQISLEELEHKLGVETGRRLDRQQLRERLEELPFHWPLKPYGVDKSLEKTAVMNKGAETLLYMDELESHGLYDPRNPTGPLPTSLRPQLNRLLQQEGLEGAVVDRVYDLMQGSGVVTHESLKSLFLDSNAIDYYEFLKLFLGPETIKWD